MKEKLLRLYDASLCGNVEWLKQLMEEDELILDRISITFFDETPLHVAAMRGHVDFAKALLSYNSSFVAKLDSHGCSPLHLASANGFVDMVKLMLLFGDIHDVCLIRDEDGRTPLHLGVINGHVGVVKELVRARPEAAKVAMDGGESVLHSCVVYNRFEVLRILMELDCVQDMVNIVDDNGNTILHLATTLKRVQMTKYLISRKDVKVDEVNEYGCTAFDIIQQQTPKDIKTMQIQQLLVSSLSSTSKKNTPELPTAAASRHFSPTGAAINHHQPPPTAAKRRGKSHCNHIKKYLKKKHSRLMKKPFMKIENKPRLEKKVDALMVAASVIAAMAYQAAISPPGGVFDQEQTIERNGVKLKFDAGTSILSSVDPGNYKKFCSYNTTAFIASISIIFLFVCGLPVKRRILGWILTAAMWVTVTATAFTYDIAIESVTPGDEGFEKQHFSVVIIVKIALFTWLMSAAGGMLFFISRVVVSIVRNEQRKSARRRVSRSLVDDRGEVDVQIIA